MFQFLFRYPAPTFSKGEFVLLGSWPKWLLCLFILAAIAGLGWLIRSRLPQAAPLLRSWRAGVRGVILRADVIELSRPFCLGYTLRLENTPTISPTPSYLGSVILHVRY